MTVSFRARSGIDTGGGNGIYWVKILKTLPNGNLLLENIPDRGRKKIPQIQRAVESSLIYPLLRGKDVERWSAIPSDYIIVPHSPSTGMEAISEQVMKLDYPKTYNFLLSLEDYISERRTLKIFGGSTKHWYSLFKIGQYTFSPYKVIWKEISKDMVASIVTSVEDKFLGKKVVLPDHKLMLIQCKTKKEALYLCAILNSCVSRSLVKSYAIETQISTHVLKYLKIPPFNDTNRFHKIIVSLSEKAKKLKIAKDIEELKETEKKIDEIVAFNLYELNEKELSSIKENLNILLE